MLTSKQRAQLRGLAATEDTIVHIGKGGFFNGASSDPQSGAQYKKYQENVEKLKEFL